MSEARFRAFRFQMLQTDVSVNHWSNVPLTADPRDLVEVFRVDMSGPMGHGSIEVAGAVLIELARHVLRAFDVPADPVRLHLTVDVHQLPAPAPPAESQTDAIKRHLLGG